MIDLKSLWDDFLNPKITRKRFEALTELSPKRICFGSTHRNALKKAESGPVGYFNVPFFETIGDLFPFDIFKNKFGYSRTIKSDEEFEEIAAWIEKNREVVFIRSLLDSCVEAAQVCARTACKNSFVVTSGNARGVDRAKAAHGLTKRQAPNRLSTVSKVKPCPEEKRSAIEEALRHFRMI